MKRLLILAARWSWRLLMAWLLLIVLLVAGFRVFLGFLPLFHEQAVAYLNDQLDTAFVVERLEARWHGGKPTFSLRNLSLKGHDAEEAGIAIDQLDLEVNLRDSLLHLTPILSYLKIDGVQISLESDAQGRWTLSGIANPADSSEQESDPEALLKFLEQQEFIDLTNLSLKLKKYGEEAVNLHTRNLLVVEESGLKQFEVGMETDTGVIEFKALGRGANPRTMNWTGSLSIDNVDLAPFINLGYNCKTSDCQKTLQRSLLNATTAWDFREGQWQVHGDVWVPYVNYRAGSGEAGVLSLQSDVFMKGRYFASRFRNLDVWLNNLQVTSSEPAPLLLDLYGRVEPADDGQGDLMVSATSSAIDLEQLRQFIFGSELLPESAQELVTTLNPAGQINELAVRFYPSRPLTGQGNLDLSARLEDISVDAWEEAPSADHVNGYVRMSALSGYLDLETTDFSLGLTNLFRDVWQYSSASARLYWDVVDDTYRLRSDDIALAAEEGQIRGRLNLDIPLDSDPALEDRPVTMALAVGITEGNAVYATKYLPAKLPAMPDELVSWLDTSIKGAQVNAGGFLYNGVLGSSGDALDTRWGLFFDLDEAHLDYDPDWPAVSEARGQVVVNDDLVDVQIASGRALDAQLENVTARLLLEDDPLLEINGRVRGSGKDAMRILTESPIDEVLSGEARNWLIQGQFDSDMHIAVPFDRPTDTRVDLDIRTTDGLFSLPAQNLSVEHIRGAIAFSTETGLAAENVKARLLGEEITASIVTDLENGEPARSLFSWQGIVGAGPLHQWLQLDWLSLLEGQTGYSGALRINYLEPSFSVQVESDLEGMEIELPRPLGISAEEVVPFSMNMDFGGEGEALTVQLGDVGRLRALFGGEPDEPFSLDSATISMGTESDWPEMEKGRIKITGHIPELDLQPWQEMFQGQPGDEEELSLAEQVEVDQLRIGRVIYGDYSLDNINFSVQPASEGGERYTRFGLDSQDIAGNLLKPDRQTLPYRLELDRLHLPETGEDDKKEDSEDFLQAVLPEELPDADISIKSLRVGEQNMGSVAFSLRPLSEGKRIQGVKATLSSMQFSGSADWIYRQDKHRTSEKGRLTGKDIEKFQESMGFAPFVTARESEIDTRLAWDGSPLGINLESLDGTVKLKLKNGTLKKLEGGAGALKLFGILNTESLTRRLRLDFSDLYSTGIAFDELESVLRFDNGVITFDEPLTVQSPSSNFKMDGSIDTVTETLDISLVVTLPVTSNLPVLSYLLGTAPQVAGIIFLADKLVGKQVDQLASIRYTIEGSFDDPEVSLDQLFSSKAKKPSKKTSP